MRVAAVCSSTPPPAAARERNVKKASLLYDTIAGSNGFYFSPVEESVRSKMNVPFTIPRCDAAAAAAVLRDVCCMTQVSAVVTNWHFP
jgi:phosphoserine aminotransferase